MASYDIGPRIGIEGENEFRKSLINLSEQIKTLGTEMAATTAEFSGNEKSQKALKAQSEILTKEVETQREKVKMLSEAVAKSAEEYGESDTKTLKWKQALNNATAELEKTEKQLEETNDELRTHRTQLSEISEGWKDAGDKISGAGKTLSAATVAITGLATAAIKTTAEFDSSMSKVAAVSGATGESLDALREKAREMGEKTKFSASEAADAMNYMAMAGWKTEDMLSGIEGIMNLAAASGEDLATTSDIVTDALTAFGLTAADSGHFADILAAASSNANTNVAMMGETFKYAAPVAGALGFSAEDTAEAIGLMANSGIKASQAGTSLRSILNALTGEVVFCGSALGETTIQTSNADGTMRELSDILADCRVAFSQLTESEQASAAESLVGKNAMSGFLALMNAAPADIDKLSTAINDCTGSSEQMAAVMQDNLSGQLQILKSQTEELMISFGEMLVPVIRSVINHVQDFVDKLNNMDEGQRQTIITVAAVVAAIGPVLIVVGKVISAVGTIIGILPKAKAAIMAVNAVLSANPIGAVIALIAALVAAFIYLWNNCEEFRNFFVNLWETVSTAVKTAIDKVTGFLGDLWNSFLESIKSAKTWGKDMIKNFTDGITEKWNALKDKVAGIAQGIKDFLGFSEPKAGPLSNFHTYAPDMMMLYAKGIRDNAWRVKDQLAASFSDVDSLMPGVADVRGGSSTGRGVVSLDGGTLAAIRGGNSANPVVKIEFTGNLAQLGRILQPEIQTAAGYAGASLVM